MKLKKVTSVAIVAAMLLSAVSVAAVNVPQPKDNAEAYQLAEAFYHDGYYYEAQAELAKVDPNGYFYDANKQAAWMDKVNYKINRLAIQAILADVKKLNSELKFAEGLVRLQDADKYDITSLEYYSLVWWENALTKNLNNPKYAAKVAANTAVVKSGISAISKVKEAGYPLNSNYEWYSPVKVEDGYHVYIKTRTPSGVSENVAAFRVSADGTVLKVF